MAKKKPTKTTGNGLHNVKEYRHTAAKRKNNPPAALAEQAAVPAMPKAEYSYSPRRPPTLQFDPTGDADKPPDLVAQARKRPLTEDEARILAEALRTQEPWLEWAGKRESEADGFAVDPVALHIHERISSQAILRVAARQDVERTLFGDPEQEYHEAVQFYRHDIDWTNRLILGDSLQVMASLAHREDLAGKVQMIYMDPPYGIRFSSNFQPEVGKRNVQEKESDLTREPEMVRAYRDTWHLGIHSYLRYLRERLCLARDMLADSGSVFVQISDENLHHVKELLDAQFGPKQFISIISVRKTGGATSETLPTVTDHILWYCRSRENLKYRQLFAEKTLGEEGATEYTNLQLPDGAARKLTDDETNGRITIPLDAIIYATDSAVSDGFRTNTSVPFTWADLTFDPGKTKNWKTTIRGMLRLCQAGRIVRQTGFRIYKRHFTDFPFRHLNNIWMDVRGALDRAYVVQTSAQVVQRCMLMTTEPGDLVLDPTCGSGTTAYVAEQWGRPWITIDTSRVAVAIARQRLLTAKYDYYKLRDENAGPASGFTYKNVPHITLKSIGQNPNLDSIFAKHAPILDAKLTGCKAALAKVGAEVRQKLEGKLLEKQKKEGKKAITDADRRRWELPAKGAKWEHWQVPFDADPDWPKELANTVTAYRQAWRAKMDEVNACIAANAEQEELVDQPEVDRKIVRVSGPFTVEAVQPPEMSVGDVVDTLSPIGGAPNSLESFAPARTVRIVEPRNEYAVANVEAYLDDMTAKLRLDGVRFPGNKEMTFTRLNRIKDPSGIHAEGRWTPKGQADPDPEGTALVGVVFGPQYGPVTMPSVEKLIKPAGRRYDDLVIAAFNFTAEVYDLVKHPEHPKLRIHAAHISPDVNPAMNGLLKQQRGSQLFTVFGQPRTELKGPDENGDFMIVMEGMDIYNPVTNAIDSTGDQKVAAWFLDGDYDGRTFCITQAFFPDRTAWEKLAKALGGIVDPDRFEALSGTVSLPFPAGKHKCAAVKVIDPRGNEVMQVHKLG